MKSVCAFVFLSFALAFASSELPIAPGPVPAGTGAIFERYLFSLAEYKTRAPSFLVSGPGIDCLVCDDFTASGGDKIIDSYTIWGIATTNTHPDSMDILVMKDNGGPDGASIARISCKTTKRGTSYKIGNSIVYEMKLHVPDGAIRVSNGTTVWLAVQRNDNRHNWFTCVGRTTTNGCAYTTMKAGWNWRKRFGLEVFKIVEGHRATSLDSYSWGKIKNSF